MLTNAQYIQGGPKVKPLCLTCVILGIDQK